MKHLIKKLSSSSLKALFVAACWLLVFVSVQSRADVLIGTRWQVESGAEPSDMEEASGGASVQIKNGDGTTSANYPNASRSKSQTFSLTCPGTYYLKVRYRAPGGNNDSWWFHILQSGVMVTDNEGNDDVTSNSDAVFNMDDDNAWHTEDVRDDNDDPGDRREWNLTNTSANAITVIIRGREDETELSWLELWQVGSGTCGTPSPTPTSTPVGTGTGLNGLYYDNMTLTDPFQCRQDSTVSFNWPGSPDGGAVSGIGGDTFSVRWQGQVELPTTGIYTWFTTTDDGVRLWVNGVLVIDQWIDQGPTEVNSGPINYPTAGKFDIVMEFYENGGGAESALRWQGPGIAKQLVPTDRLYIPGGTACSFPSPTQTPNWTATPTAPGTATYTVSPTSTPFPATTGLNKGGRLYGLEYIPFPAQTTGGQEFWDLGKALTSATINIGEPRNTARWRIVFKDLSVTVGTEIKIETRIGSHESAVECYSGEFGIVADTLAPSGYRLEMPTRPQNLSNAYAWLDAAAVPFTEQVDLMGDPRYIPYFDMLSLPAGQPFADNYNWFFMNLTTTIRNPAVWNDDNTNEYPSFLTRADWDGFGGDQVNADVPKAFALIRDGLQTSASIYTSMSGWSSYYVGFGGEIGGDASNDITAGPDFNNGPYGAGGSSPHLEIRNSTEGIPLIRTSSAGWHAKPFIGELWPDWDYVESWSSAEASNPDGWGNLPNGNSGTRAYKRDGWTDSDQTSNGGYTGYFSGISVIDYFKVARRTGSGGSSSFMNGSGNGSASFNHAGADGMMAPLLPDGDDFGLQYNFSMTDPKESSRPFGTAEGGSSPEWSQSPYNLATNRNVLSIYSSNTTDPANSIGYYHWAGNLGSTTRRASAAVRSYNPGTQNAAWMIVNGFTRAGIAGAQFLAKFAILSCFRTFHDAGAPVTFPGYTNNSNLYAGNELRIEPVPLVVVVSTGADSASSTSGLVPLRWESHYMRWDEDRYTKYYPAIPTPVANSNTPDPDAVDYWHSLPTTEIAFNAKFSIDGGGSWYHVGDDPSVDPAINVGEYYDTRAITSTARTLYYDWDVSGLDPGNKLLRIELHRPNYTQHYSFHEVPLYTSP